MEIGSKAPRPKVFPPLIHVQTPNFFSHWEMKKEQKDRTCVMDDPIRSSSFVQSLREAWGFATAEGNSQTWKREEVGTLIGEEAKGLPDIAIKLQEAQLNLNYLQMKFQHKMPVKDIHIFLKTFIVYLKFYFNWLSYILSGNLVKTAGMLCM